jgi:DNA-binding CsgD family transcriptional regulator
MARCLILNMSIAEPRHRLFVEETMRLVGSTLGAQRLAFYEVDREQNLQNFVLERIPPEFHRQYLREMFAFDPLHMQRIGDRDVAVARLADASRYAPSDHIQRYGRFLRRFSAVDTAELVFRNEHGVIAGLNVTWTEGDLPTSAATYVLAEQLHRYIQFSLTSRLATARAIRLDAVRCLGLTPRECEVALLVCEGHANPQVAARLGIELSTVKTHLLRIYEKCAVKSRSGLVARLSAPDS